MLVGSLISDRARHERRKNLIGWSSATPYLLGIVVKQTAIIVGLGMLGTTVFAIVNCVGHWTSGQIVSSSKFFAFADLVGLGTILYRKRRWVDSPPETVERAAKASYWE